MKYSSLLASSKALSMSLAAVLSLSACSLQQSPSFPPNETSDEGAFVLDHEKPVLPSAQAKLLPAPNLIVTREVRAQLQDYLRGDANFVRESLARRNQHYRMLVSIFEDEGVPRDLLNLAIVESGFNREARSFSGAVGMWQFMKGTARRYGLKVERHQDQRKDIVLSTLAAARHLKDLFIEHQNWYLALAAYNAGSGAVYKAERKAGTSDFWKLARQGHFVGQTRRFVPKFIAATILSKTIDRYGAENLERNVNIHIASASSPGEPDRFAIDLPNSEAPYCAYCNPDIDRSGGTIAGANMSRDENPSG